MPKKQADGRYRAKITVGHTSDGKPVFKYVSGRTRPELEKAKQAAIAYYVDGAVTQSDRFFGEYAVEWYHANKEPHISKSSSADYRTIFNKYLLPEFGDRMLRSIKPTDLQLWLNTFSGASKTRITMIMMVLRGVFKSACQEGILQRDPSAFLETPKTKKAEKRRALTLAERSMIEKTIAEHEDGLLLAVLYYLGLRRGEALGLQWGDIDFSKGVLHVQRDIDFKATRAKGDPMSSVGELKTDAADREVIIPHQLLGMLVHFRGMPNAFLFAGGDGQPLAKATFERKWIRLMEHAGLVTERTKEWGYTDIRAQLKPEITPHFLRHNYVTMLCEAGVDPIVAMRLAGHADYKTTANVYTHLNSEYIQSMRAALNGVFQK